METTFYYDFDTGEIEIGEGSSESRRKTPRCDCIFEPIKRLPSDFVAIDFETANHHRCSPCALALAIVHDNKVVETREYLIKPHKNEPFIPFNIGIHGITPEAVSKSPEFDKIFHGILPIIDNNILVAHNMSFDASVLWNTMELYNLDRPHCKTICSCNISRIIYPDLCSHRLDIISSHLGIPLNHHDAASDAVACANIIIHAAETAADTITQANYSYGYISPDGRWSPQYKLERHNIKKLPDKWIHKAECASGLCNCDFVFTGTLKSMKREDAFELVRRAGGRASESINNNTEYLVMGLQDYAKFADGLKSSKTKKAEELRAQGHPIEIISEEDFLKMLNFD